MASIDGVRQLQIHGFVNLRALARSYPVRELFSSGRLAFFAFDVDPKTLEFWIGLFGSKKGRGVIQKEL